MTVTANLRLGVVTLMAFIVATASQSALAQSAASGSATTLTAPHCSDTTRVSRNRNGISFASILRIRGNTCISRKAEGSSGMPGSKVGIVTFNVVPSLVAATKVAAD